MLKQTGSLQVVCRFSAAAAEQTRIRKQPSLYCNVWTERFSHKVALSVFLLAMFDFPVNSSFSGDHLDWECAPAPTRLTHRRQEERRLQCTAEATGAVPSQSVAARRNEN